MDNLNFNKTNTVDMSGNTSGNTSGFLTINTIGVHFTNMEAFETFMATPFLAIELVCGCKKEYNDKQDIPAENVKCEHDNYFIKIGE